MSMRNFLFLVTILQKSFSYIPFWPPQSFNVPIGGPVLSVPPSPPMSSMESSPLYGLSGSVPMFSNYNQQPITNTFMPVKAENVQPESPWMSLVKTVASVMNNSIDWEREKSYLNKSYQLTPKIEESAPTSYAGTWNEHRTSDREEINFEYDPVLFRSGARSFARLVNSIPAPSLLFQIGDLLQTSLHDVKSTVRTTTVSTSFPIEKDEPFQAVDDGNIIGLVTTGRWKHIDWTRKILGIDEIPTKEEGNAIAQLLDEDFKSGKQ